MMLSGAAPAPELLNHEERQWLASHPVIRLAYEPGYAPITFVDARGQVKGLSVEYVQLLEKKLGIRFQIVEPHDMAINLDKVRAGEVDVLTSLMRTPERSEYLLFTKPYLIVPAVIIVRNDFKDELELSRMAGTKIAVVAGYAVQAYVRSRFPMLDLVSVNTELACLRMLSFGEVDAAVVDMASASYLIQQEGISNLRVAGETGFTYNLSLASRKDWPLLNRILEKGLAAISTQEHDSIKSNWMRLERTPFVSRSVWIGILVVLSLVTSVTLGVMVWNRSLARMVAHRSQELTEELAERRQVEATLRQVLAEKQTLIRELYHRTKNNLQIVSSLMNLRMARASAEARATSKEMDNRIQGLALVHQMLYQSGDLSSLDLTEYLHALVKLVVRNFWGSEPSVTVVFTGEPLPVTLDIASPCGLVINELLTNTFKHAFPDDPNGVITIRVRRDGPEHLVLEYADNGVGLPAGVDPRKQETLGLQSLFAIVEQQLSGEVRITRGEGLGFVLRIATSHYQKRV
jgi:two-component sensor histidine kinase/ABC-type amino acid transport substrate-binding protein